MAKSRPIIIVSAAMSIDGKMATRTGRSNLSSKKDLVRLHGLRKNVDAILVGKNTVRIDDPLLTVRYVRGKNPSRIVLDPHGELSLKSKIIRTAKTIPTFLVTLESTRNLEKFEKRGIHVIKCGGRMIDLRKLLDILGGKGMKKILVEGGGNTNWHFFREGLVDEIMVTVAPYVIGGSTAISLVEGAGFASIGKQFKLKRIRKMQNELVLHYVS